MNARITLYTCAESQDVDAGNQLQAAVEVVAVVPPLESPQYCRIAHLST